MIEVMNWIAQDDNHILGTLAFIFAVGFTIEGIVKAARKPAKDSPMTDDFTPCERTIHMCLDALPECWLGSRERIAALLPKPDPAKALYEEWYASGFALRPDEASAMSIARWLFETGRMK